MQLFSNFAILATGGDSCLQTKSNYEGHNHFKLLFASYHMQPDERECAACT
jgi:hypothetical protein